MRPERIARADIFDALCSSADVMQTLNRHNPKRLNLINEAWGWILEQEEFLFDSAGRLLFESRSEPGVIRHADGRFCDCPSRVACTHNEAASLIGRARRYNQIDRSRVARGEAVPFCERPSRRQLVDWGNKSGQELIDELFA